MMKRAAFVSGGAAALAASTVPVSAAAQFTWKFADDATIDHPINVRAIGAFEKIRRDTNGQLDIRLFPNNQLGGVTAMLTQLRSGAIEMHVGAGGVLDSVVPVASIENVAYAFPTRHVVFDAMDGDLGKVIRAAILDKQIMSLDRVWENGYRNFTNSLRPIRTVADLDGLKLRVSPSKLRFDTFRSMGASVSSLPSSELYTALQTHVVDGQETPLTYVETQRYYEVQKFASMSRHMWSGYWTLINLDAWNTLPPAFQKILSKHLNEAAVLARHDTDLLDQAVHEKLSRQGMAFNDVDVSGFKAKLVSSGYYARWKAEFGETAWNALEKYSGKLG